MIWSETPSKIQFGFGMVITDIALDKDHTLTMYCEKECVAKVLPALIKLIKDENRK